MVFGFGLNHTSESSMRAKYTIYLPSFLAAIHYYVAFPLTDILFITKDPLLVPQESRNVDVHSEGSVMDIHRELQTCSACQDLPTLPFLSKSDYPSWSYCPFFIKFLKF